MTLLAKLQGIATALEDAATAATTLAMQLALVVTAFSDLRTELDAVS